MNNLNLELDKIRNSFGDYCINTYKSKCCKFGKLLLLNKKEVNLFSQDNSDFIEKSTNDVNHHYFNFEKNGDKCKFLDKEGMCKVYKNPSKPKVCNDFPIFKTGDFVLTAGSCPAITTGLVDDKLKELCEKHNLKLI